MNNERRGGGDAGAGGEGVLSERLNEATVYALRLHAAQVRKGTPIPYAAHLFAVCALVLEDGGDEDEAIAALLHDAVEDQGGQATLAAIRERFGGRVAAIVWGCTDADVQPKPPWRARKEAYVAHLDEADASVRRVSLADKLHNARAIVADVRRHAPALWTRFTGGRDGTLWYYRALADAFLRLGCGDNAHELARVVAEMERLAAAEKET